MAMGDHTRSLQRTRSILRCGWQAALWRVQSRQKYRGKRIVPVFKQLPTTHSKVFWLVTTAKSGRLGSVRIQRIRRTRDIYWEPHRPFHSYRKTWWAIQRKQSYLDQLGYLCKWMGNERLRLWKWRPIWLRTWFHVQRLLWSWLSLGNILDYGPDRNVHFMVCLTFTTRNDGCRSLLRLRAAIFHLDICASQHELHVREFLLRSYAEMAIGHIGYLGHNGYGRHTLISSILLHDLSFLHQLAEHQLVRFCYLWFDWLGFASYP